MQIGPHRVQDAPLYGLEAVADVGQGARGDHAQRVIEIARPCRLRQRDILDEPVAPGLSVLSLAASAVPFRHRLALDLDPEPGKFVIIRQIKPSPTRHHNTSFPHRFAIDSVHIFSERQPRPAQGLPVAACRHDPQIPQSLPDHLSVAGNAVKSSVSFCQIGSYIELIGLVVGRSIHVRFGLPDGSGDIGSLNRI